MDDHQERPMCLFVFKLFLKATNMELNRSESLFDFSVMEKFEGEFNEEKPFPLTSAENQHLVSQRIAQGYLEQFNDSITTYLQAKKDGRYAKPKDLFGEVCVLDEAKNALFESLVWAFELRSFERITFATCCCQADDEHYGDPENIRYFLAKHMKSELLEMVDFIRSSTPADKAKRIVDKLSEYVTCPALPVAVAKEVSA